MNVLSCGGVYRRITLALSACALVYLFIFHQDVPREFHFGVEYESEDSVSHGNDSLSHVAHISSVKKSSRSSLPDKCTDPKSDRSRIVFLKTHKTASSTIQNILMRYGTKVSTNKLFLSRKKWISGIWLENYGHQGKSDRKKIWKQHLWRRSFNVIEIWIMPNNLCHDSWFEKTSFTWKGHLRMRHGKMSFTTCPLVEKLAVAMESSLAIRYRRPIIGPLPYRL